MKRVSLALAVAIGCGSLLIADDFNGVDPGPGRGVARLSLINGDVSVRRGDTGDVVAAAVNAPLMAQDAVLTSSAARAELQFDAGAVLRIGANSEVRLGALDANKYQVQVAIGTVTFTLLQGDSSQVELDTASLSIRPLGPGAYRLTVHEDGTSEITARGGDAQVDSGHGSQRLAAGQTMLTRGNPADPEFQIVAAAAPDGWDHWNNERDQFMMRSQSRQYVSPDIPGAEDLDSNGRWVNDPTYGNVWAPNVDPGWAPYRNGEWVWEDWYGWTWVSYDPWGWAPYHYGRWFYGPVGWAWYPGPLRARYFWAPAYVGFFGFGGGGFGIGFGFANVGWVPLAPFEPLHPWWGRGWGPTTIFRNTVIVNNVNVYNTFRNARVVNGISGVNAAQFGRPGVRFGAFNGAQIREAALVHGVPAIAPTRASTQFVNRSVNAANFPAARAQGFFARSQPVQRTPFEQQQRAFGNFGAMQRQAPNLGTAGGADASHGWSRFGQPLHNPGAQSPALGRSGSYAPQENFRGAPQGAGPYGAPAYEQRQQAAPQQTAPMYGGRNNFGAPSGPVRISPPIVRERPGAQPYGGYNAPAYGGAGRSFGGRYTTPSAPAPRGSAPSPSFGGGRPAPSGGSSRSFSGGGGHSGGGHRGR